MLANHKRNINSFVEIIKLTPSLPSSSFIFLSAALSPVIISTASNTSLIFVGKRHGSDRLGSYKDHTCVYNSKSFASFKFDGDEIQSMERMVDNSFYFIFSSENDTRHKKEYQN